MDPLFAPWRIEWVSREPESTNTSCPFCSIPAESTDRENLVVARSEHTYVLLNNYPYNPGHAMVIPYRHVISLDELTDAELLDRARMTQRCVRAFSTMMQPDGFNTGANLGRAGGGSIDHLHTHVVPRWVGDTNFMAVIDDTKVIVQALEDTWEGLHSAFASQDGTTVDAADKAVRIEKTD